MKTLTLSLILILPILTAHAVKMDSETQNLVIEKIERVLSQMAQKDSSWSPTQLRLSDLLAERARLRYMTEVESNCDGCKGSGTDRRKALSLYKEVIPTLTYAQKGRVYFQMAHLHLMADENAPAIAIYEGILKNQNAYSQEVVTRAHVALADVLFQQGKFKRAMEHYVLALKDPNAPQKGLIHYRMAWCDFNTDKLPKAVRSLETLARTPSLLTKETSDGKTIPDLAFQNDVLRDLATFYARQKITSIEIATYQKLVPDDQKKDLLMFFGQEADRLGQKQAAADIYRIYLQTAGLDAEEQLEGFMLMAQANYDKGQTKQSTQDFGTAAVAYKKTACYSNAKKSDETQDKCDKIQKRMRHFVTEFHRSKKSKPDMEVLNAYVVYAQTFPQDTQMAILGAQVASELKQYRAAASLYRFGSESSKDETLRDKALAGEIEATEKTGDAKLREDVYKRYLAVRPNGANSYEVRYQLAHISYERKEWKSAATQFHTLALANNGKPELRKKSADLALDGLAIEKNDALIEQWAAEFAVAMPQHRDEFTAIQRKAVVNQTAATANNKKASDSELKSALKKMQKVSLANSTDAEKIVHYRNQLVLADKLNDDAAILSSLSLLLAVPSLSAEDQEEALARKVGYYEKRLDFKSAYQTALRMRFPALKPADKEVRLGTLAELAGLNGMAHYKAALDKGLSGPSKATVLSRLVQSSPNPVAAVKKYKRDFAQYPSVFSETLVLVYNRTKNLNDIEPFLQSGVMAQTPAGKFVRKQRYFSKHQAFHKRISSHKLNTSSDRRLQNSIAERIQLLKEADKSVKEANSLNDFTAQILALSTMSYENNRMVYDLNALPLPRGLKPQEQAQYMALLKKQSSPYAEKSQVAAQKLNEFWKNEKVIVRLADEYAASRPELRSLLVTEIGILIALSPNPGIRAYLKSALGKNAASTTPSQKELNSARESVRANPESVNDLEKLKNLETKSGHPLMVSYLEGRLDQIRTEKSL